MAKVRFPEEGRNISLLHRIQICSVVYPTSYRMGTWYYFSVIKWQAREAGHSFPSSAKVKNVATIRLHIKHKVALSSS